MNFRRYFANAETWQRKKDEQSFWFLHLFCFCLFCVFIFYYHFFFLPSVLVGQSTQTDASEMTKHYSYNPRNVAIISRARAVDVRTHFKNMREVCAAIKGMSLIRAKKYLHRVIRHREIVPFRRYNGGVGRKAQCKQWHMCTQGRWPRKSCTVMLALLRNAQANAETKQLDLNRLYIHHVAAQHAPKMRRRMYRAHGRITPFMTNPSHIELVLRQRPKKVRKPKQPKKTETKA